MIRNIAGKRLETKALVIGYAMSRLDRVYLSRRGLANWRKAYDEASRFLGELPATFKNLRDEFDPVHLNPRRGWHMRPLRTNRQTVLEELREVSDEALLALVEKVLSGAEDEIKEAIDSLARVTRVAANVAERLLTGKRAEEHFMANCEQIVNIPPERLIDFRSAASGYDFGVDGDPCTAIEVKGMKRVRGDILFTDREWTEAKTRRDKYLLVVVGNLLEFPKAAVVNDPWNSLSVCCHYQKTISVSWTSRISVGQRRGPSTSRVRG